MDDRTNIEAESFKTLKRETVVKLFKKSLSSQKKTNNPLCLPKNNKIAAR